MRKTLNVVLDVSGGFAENGKIEILRALKLSTEAFADKFGATVEFFIWREEIRPFAQPSDLVPVGKAEIPALCSFVEKFPASSKILLLSDGIWSSSDTVAIRRAIKSSGVDLIFVAVGVGAADSKNYDVSTFGGIWQAVDLGAAVQTLIFANGDAR